ncbi:MAG: FHA domain-containing protein [Polyangiaceae bacterium]
MAFERLRARISRLFSADARDLAAARAAELRGDLPRAIELYDRAGDEAEAARVMLLRAESDPNPTTRLQLLVQAERMTPEGEAHDALRGRARIARAKTVVLLAKGNVLSAAIRADVLQAAKTLEESGAPEDAADAYRLSGDREAEARALAAAGKIDELEALLDSEQVEQRMSRAKAERLEAIDQALVSGQRREALRLADAVLTTDTSDRAARDRAESLRAKRVAGAVVRIDLDGAPCSLVLGAEVIVGRVEGAIRIPSQALSRRHLRITRTTSGVVVGDLGSRNGTHLRGIAIGGEIPVGEGVDLALGGEVPLRISPADELLGAVAIEVGGARYVAPLGPATVGTGDWQLVLGAEEWVELHFARSPAFAGDVAVSSPVTLLTGDAFSAERSGSPKIRLL